MKNTFQDTLRQGLNLLGLSTEPGIEERLENFHRLVFEWNQKFNLTSITDDKESAEKHFVDSLTLGKFIDLKGPYLLCDVGTGAGFPGMPLKIFYPDLRITLFDSLQKRVNFLQYAIEQFGLKDIKAIHGRVEEIGQQKEHRESFDIVVSRAVARLNILAEYCLPLVKIGGTFVAMKGPDGEKELKEATKAIEMLGGKVKFIEKIKLPLSGDARCIIVISKECKTPHSYPRRPGIPVKKPLI